MMFHARCRLLERRHHRSDFACCSCCFCFSSIVTCSLSFLTTTSPPCDIYDLRAAINLPIKKTVGSKYQESSCFSVESCQEWQYQSIKPVFIFGDCETMCYNSLGLQKFFRSFQRILRFHEAGHALTYFGRCGRFINCIWKINRSELEPPTTKFTRSGQDSKGLPKITKSQFPEFSEFHLPITHGKH